MTKKNKENELQGGGGGFRRLWEGLRLWYCQYIGVAVTIRPVSQHCMHLLQSSGMPPNSRKNGL